MTIVAAKNENLRSGLGQCIAAMVAAELLNQSEPDGARSVHGAVTSGCDSKFLRLTGAEVTIDLVEYHIDNLGKIMGILDQMIRQT